MTVMLYNDPHPVHRRMAEAIDATLVEADKGGPFSRFLSATSSYYSQPVIIEGGVPLLETGFLGFLRRVRGPVIMLAADETLHDIDQPLSYYSSIERWAHRFGLRYVDGFISVSGDVHARAIKLSDSPSVISEPFVLEDRASDLSDIYRSFENGRVLCVGEYRPANNQDSLVEATELCETEVSLDLVGKGTEDAPGGDGVTKHGFVSDDELIELYKKSDLYVFPAVVGAFPVTTLEALLSGLPILVSNGVGTWSLANELHVNLVTTSSPEDIARDIDWFFDLDLPYRVEMAGRARELGQRYTEEDGIVRFKEAYSALMEQVYE